MGKLTRRGYGVLDALVADMGSDYIHDMLMERLSLGESPAEIARAEFGVPWVVLRGWIEEHCADAVALAGRARADMLEWEATKVVREADQETLGVAKLRSEHFMKLAGKLDRNKYGEKATDSGGSGLTVVVQRGGILSIGVAEEKGYPPASGGAVESVFGVSMEVDFGVCAEVIEGEVVCQK